MTSGRPAARTPWLLGGAEYLALIYLTFIYRWQPRPQIL